MSTDHNHAVEAWRVHGDENAARELMAALYPQVARIARRHLPFRMAEEDLVQEIFVKLFRNLHRFDPQRPLENWVSRLALNVCRDHLRARACRPELRWADLSAEERRAVDSASHSPDSADEAVAADASALLQKLLETLGADDRLVLTLLHLEEKSVDEICAITGWNRPRVKVRAFRARARMRKVMQALERGRS